MRKYNVRLVDDEYLRENFSCYWGCPVFTEAGAYVQAIAEGDNEKAYAISRGPNPFASICGRVCAHPCEEVCRKGVVEEKAIGIRALKRYVTEMYGVEARQLLTLEDTLAYSTAPGSVRPKKTGKRVAIVGAGPAGLTCAHDLARLGHDCTIFEAQGIPGGMMILGVPEYRLTRDLIKREIDAILAMGIEIRYHAKLGRDFLIKDLWDEGFDAIFIGIGAHVSTDVRLPGMELDGAISGVEFLLNANLGYKVDMGKKAIVIGGGDVAMDAARTAQRIGADRVDVSTVESPYVIYRRSRKEMPARPIDVEHAEEEGVKFLLQTNPTRVIGDEKGKVVGIECVKMELGEPDASGRRRPVPVPGSEFQIDADTVIFAIGQEPDLSWVKEDDGIEISDWRLIQVDEITLATSAAGIFAGGDVAFGPKIIIDAVADGQRAARSIHAYLGTGLKFRKDWKSTVVDHRMPEDFDRTPYQNPPVIDVGRRTGVTEVEKCYNDEEALTEARRCYKCNINTIFSNTKCIMCGGCADICPENCYRLIDVKQIRMDETIEKLLKTRFGVQDPEGMAIIKDEERCTRCALCVVRCPTGAITMELYEEKEVVV